ncbi:MAG TPA: DUF3943 domain-containing protein [Geobacter sp.]|nr:DUF3943 domain-containing protein [Geobacter sp.]
MSLLLAVFAGTAYGAPENVADLPVEKAIPATDQDLQFQRPIELQASDSLLEWRKAGNQGYSQLALFDLDPSPEFGESSTPVLSRETGAGKSYLIPALEIPAFVILLNVFDRLAFPNKMKEGRKAYSTNLSTTWDHLRRQNWHFDKDSFEVNQFGHPYEGATMYGLARSSGLNFWQSFIYSHAGSFLWEMAGETSRPSTNDIITTGNAGSLLGEALFRMAGLVLEEGGDKPRGRQEFAAALLSPPTAFNRYAFGDRFKAAFPSHKPATLWQLMVGANVDVHSTNLSPEASSHNANVIADFSMSYGLPGKPGYTYRRPLDYFDFQLAMRARTSNPLEAVTVRGLLIGTDYHAGSDYRGIWGLYGSYDYLSPHLYRVSSTAVSLGTTGQYRIAPGIALQGSLLGGIGFGVAGTETEEPDGRIYHYGATPQGLVAMRLLFGGRMMLDLTGRGYYISGSSMDQVVWRGNAGLTFRVSGNHGVAIRYIESLRDTKNNAQATRHLSEGTLSLVYTYLSDKKLGAVEWREAADR